MDKNVLYQLYEVEKKSTKQIGEILGCSFTRVSRWLRKFGIKARPFSTRGLQPRLGAKLSDETKQKIGLGHKGKKLSPEHRAKVIKTLNHEKGDKNPAWKGGRLKNTEGYVLIYKPSHQRSSSTGYVLEHISVMEKHLGRKVEEPETIHHINGVKDDNRIKNLMLFRTSSEHTVHERKNKFWSSHKKASE